MGGFPLSVICRVLRVTQAGYHAWLKRPASAMAVARDALADLIKRVSTKKTNGIFLNGNF